MSETHFSSRSEMSAQTRIHRDRFLADLFKRPQVMGILNVTPDSFSDGGHFDTVTTALAQARQMAAEGADVLDIGGESTRPGATPLGESDELSRVLPVIRAIRNEIDLPISIDTYKANVARAAVAEGAAIINDVWGLQKDPDMAAAVAETEAAVVLMHNRAADDPKVDMLAEVRAFLDHSLSLARAAGVPDKRILLDPGIGFGKDIDQNIALMQSLGTLHSSGLPVLLGLSRKRLIGHATGRAPMGRTAGTVAANLVGIARGARVIRVHDVAEHVDALKVTALLEANG